MHKYFGHNILIQMFFFCLQLMAVQEESGSALPVDIFRKLSVIVICDFFIGYIRNIV